MAILISIKPEYVCKILNREKTLEVRTTCPADWKKYLDGKTNIKPKPCKVYIYCTKGKNKLFIPQEFNAFEFDEFSRPYIAKKPILEECDYLANGKVVAEFTLKLIDKIADLSNFMNREYIYQNAKITEKELWDYSDGGTKTMYGWHIDDLIIYDDTKELSEFQKDLDCDDYPCNKGKYCEYDYYDYCEGCEACGIDFDGSHCIYKQLKKPPQSWCYVEELER